MKEYHKLRNAAKIMSFIDIDCAERMDEILHTVAVELAIEHLSTEEGAYKAKKVGLLKALMEDIGVFIRPFELPKTHWAYKPFVVKKKKR